MQTKYDIIGKGYNTTRQADPYLISRLLHHLNPQNDKQYLDNGCGTGNYTCALHEKGFHFTGVDPSEKMLVDARMKNQNINWFTGSAEKIPAGNKQFDGVIGTLTIHHWLDLKKGFSEINRVLSDQGRLVIFTSTPEQMKGYWLHHYFPVMLQDSQQQMPTMKVIQEAAESVQLKITSTEKYFIKDDLQDCFLYSGKNKPEYYFNEQIRKGISSFSHLANAVEVEYGLCQLRIDIESGNFEKIKKQYENDLGDYCFLTFEKKVQ